jgi:hypothetical protein
LKPITRLNKSYESQNWVGDLLVQRINQFEFYQLGDAIRALKDCTNESTLTDTWYPILTARMQLLQLGKDQLIPLVVSKGIVAELGAILTSLIPSDFFDKMDELGATTLDDSKLYSLRSSLEKFEAIFSAELATLDSYFISRKGIYSTKALIEHAEEAISESLREVLPAQAITDFREAGKCLAFDVFTGAGFHVLQATDAVLRKYFEKFVGKQPPEKQRNWGAFLRVLGKLSTAPGPNPKTLSMIDQIRELHRNPIVHPQDNLGVDEALVLFDLCKAAITAMAMELT